MSQDPNTLIQTMTQLEALLADEDVALRSFDLPAIARAAEHKTALEADLALAFAAFEGGNAGSWTPQQREHLLALRERVSTQAHANQRRLRASLTAVRGIVDHITGAPSGGYGRGRTDTATVRPVLTNDVG